MIRRPPRSTQGVSSAASDVYKRQPQHGPKNPPFAIIATIFRVCPDTRVVQHRQPNQMMPQAEIRSNLCSPDTLPLRCKLTCHGIGRSPCAHGLMSGSRHESTVNTAGQGH
eukprot:TRINITY_DN11023_c0_g1_i2.p4 TRINITY_DN11023_c0_g1~~TRINITY_DN11023_c0_g1_i2.p4  ORF type:complete len:111 (+),score=15.85 TRINITY_DN11023_c0_g1_i2:92-424(+)